MLVTESVVVKWSPRNKTYFSSLGYSFSNYGEGLIVKTIDLTRKSDSIVQYMCDICFEKFSTTYDNSLCNLEKNGKHICKKCASQTAASRRTRDVSLVESEFKTHNLILLDDLSIYKNNLTRLRFRCVKHPDIVQETCYMKLRVAKTPCRLCNNEDISIRQRGDKSSSWRGGVSSLHGYLRRELKASGWFIESAAVTKSKCVITNKKADHIHHLYSFSKILEEMVKEFGIVIKKQLFEYTEEELTYITKCFLTIHNRYPLGAPLSKWIHHLYHKIYGDDNTVQQFEEFKKDFHAGRLLQYDFGV